MQNPGDILLMVVVFLLAISSHESMHAYAAFRCGDATAKRMGRISLNPLVHIDLIGTVVLPAFLILMGSPVFGWARPVPVNPANLRKPWRDKAIVAAAGPAANLVLALSSVLLFAVFYPFLDRVDGLARLLTYNTVINVLLAVFNMIPAAPLDGGSVIRYFLSRKHARWFDENQSLVFIFILILWFTGILPLILNFFMQTSQFVQNWLAHFIWM
ncbi:MAG: site-2 protease family protein [bacterium]